VAITSLPLQLHHSHPMPLMAQASGVVQCTGKKVHFDYFDKHAAIVSVCMLTFSGAHVMSVTWYVILQKGGWPMIPQPQVPRPTGGRHTLIWFIPLSRWTCWDRPCVRTHTVQPTTGHPGLVPLERTRTAASRPTHHRNDLGTVGHWAAQLGNGAGSATSALLATCMRRAKLTQNIGAAGHRDDITNSQ
jgi:hypothetical protein